MDLLDEIGGTIGAFVALAALLGLALLTPLYFSGRRDLRRLREWHEHEPDHPAADLAASEAILDRAEAELEELMPETVTEVRPPEPAPTPVPAATRVTSERPALERITAERDALAPHPHWRHFVARITRPRVLVAIGVGALVLGLGGIYASEQLLSDGDGGGRGGKARPGAVVPAEVTVSVLNGTSEPGLAQKVGSDVRSNGFALGEITNTTEVGYDQTVVQFMPGQEKAAQRVARDLGVTAVQPVDREIRSVAGDADVVVIAGEDRARL